MNREELLIRMYELHAPIDQQIMMCDSREEVLMLASLMMTTARDIFKSQCGVEGAKIVIGEMLEAMK